MMPMNFSHRSDASELMDTETVSPEDFAACLADLSVVNTLTLAKRPTLAWLEKATAHLPRDSRFTLLDVGFGHGDMLRAIWRWSERRGLKAQLQGIDLNPLSSYAAKRATPSQMNIDFRTGNVFALATDCRFDFIISSLVTHHLTDLQVLDFIRWMERQSTRGWFINDLHRHPLPYHFFRMLAGLAGWHRFVRHDGPVSIARSFRHEDWQKLLAETQVNAAIKWYFPFRYCVERLKPDSRSGQELGG
jgi:2-polyprenyl-3-methyl-5-hydroxy-6-metoxy-1,4-benzoquinol methylase